MNATNNYPSGPWTGFYLEGRQPQKHRQDLTLEFGNGRITGSGSDDLGKFVVAGGYDTKTGECHWTKTYVGAHDVCYRGFREGKGIWGTWEIGKDYHGGFRIWPLAHGSGDRDEEKESQEEVHEVTLDEPVFM